MKRFLCSDDEVEDQFEHLDKYTQLSQQWKAAGLQAIQENKYSDLHKTMLTSTTEVTLPTHTTTSLKTNITGIPALITRSLPEEEGIFRACQKSEDRDSNSNCSSSEGPYTTDTTSSSSLMKKRKKTKAEREARRLNPAIYVPSLRPRFVICKGCKEELWPPNCRYHSRHCKFAASLEANSMSSASQKDQEDKIAVENLITDEK